MLQQALATLALATALTTQGHAQASVHPADGALIAPPAGEMPGVMTIMTLQWTEVRVPARLLAASGRSAVSPRRPGRFVLTWQESPAADAQPPMVAVDSRRCNVMRLVLVPCD
jgi:hypothetical protein